MDSGFAQILLEHTPDALLLLAPDGSISFLNAAAEDLFGYTRAQLLGADSSLLLAEASREDFHGVLAGLGGTAARSRQPFAGSGRRSDGTEVPVEITCSVLPTGPNAADAADAAPAAAHGAGVQSAAHADAHSAHVGAHSAPQSGPSVALSVRGAGHRQAASSGNPQSPAAASADTATHRRRTPAGAAAAPAAPAAPAAYADRDDQLRAGVLRDQLTALPNGTLFNERLAAALRRPDPVDVLLLNVDDLKSLNDMLGRSSADELLVEVARRLRNCIRPHDTVARLGGDEFVVLLTECLNADAVARRIAESLLEPMRVAGTLVRPGLSMGLASKTPQTMDGAELLRQADAALTAAKAEGPHNWLRFRPEMLNAAAHRTGGETGLRRAVELGQISVHYQPVVSPGLGAVVQFEALARWERHGTVVPPNEFLPVAEQSGLIREIGDEVLRRACAEIRPWLAGDASYSVAVNVSGLQFQNRDFATDVLAIVASTGVDARQLTLELTESAFFDADSDVLRQLRQLREAGVRIAMDDFGTGYASLGRLKELPLDTVKIDRSFVAMIKTGREQLPFFNTMVSAAHTLGLRVTAEGIETPAQAKYLMDRGCDSLQGYLFAKPAPASDLAGTMESALTAIDKVDAAR
ncbi:bifunctional diguanylate cyclase/phosphodiesterase [Arthrobacter sp. V1I7]|uniref:putative bifunctional diguanylate cyclase/phosphodiesterase n=1 Tax=Arthrobacter sp. V1I7 TaxID=3042274 RepID=UPI0027D84259|nr:EAL domain-containing protein [Arthrobacter sp. V1I7]